LDIITSSANRKTFTKNLLGFFSQYSFDGVDSDWEYPNAVDRGGQTTDEVRFTQMLRKLRAASKANGHDYIVAFTAPTSYWYIKAMTNHVD
jgi:chitinase